jgi:hypothetical protein
MTVARNFFWDSKFLWGLVIILPGSLNLILGTCNSLARLAIFCVCIYYNAVEIFLIKFPFFK